LRLQSVGVSLSLARYLRAFQSLDLIRTIFSSVDTRLAEGREYLLGNRLTLSDLAFSVAAAPVGLPGTTEANSAVRPNASRGAGGSQRNARARPAGAFALRIYQEQRDGFGGSLVYLFG
jgi:glutathione S-transferase